MGLAASPDRFDPVEPTGDLARLRRFAPAFTAAMQHIGRDQGAIARIDPVRLAAAYLDWRHTLPMHPAHRAAGVLLQALLHHAPLTMMMPAGSPESPAQFWPEGHACVTWCLDLNRTLTGGGGPGPAYFDPGTWWSFRENFAEDNAVAVPFLELFAGDDPDWDGTRRQGEDRRPPRGRPQLRVIASEPALPPETSAVIFDLAALSNADDLSVQAQCSLLADYGAALTEAEVRQRFLHRPVGLAMTYVAERTGQICPGNFIADLQRRMAKLLADGMILTEGAAETVAAMTGRGLKVQIVAPLGTQPETLSELQARFPEAECSAGVLAGALASMTGDLRRTVVVTTSPAMVSAAIAEGGGALGIAAPLDQRQALLAAGARQVLPACSTLTRMT